MAVEVTAMTSLTVLCAGSGRSAALQGAGRRVMAGEAVQGIMDINRYRRACGISGMTVLTKGYRGQGMGC